MTKTGSLQKMKKTDITKKLESSCGYQQIWDTLGVLAAS